MTITKQNDENSTILKLDGWLDITTTQELHDYLQSLEPAQSLIFDFSGLEYISSAGVREIVASYHTQKGKEGTFKVINVNPEVYDVFEMTGLIRKIDIQQAE